MKFTIIIFLVGVASATFDVEVMLNSYSNPTSEECDGGNCEGLFGGTCDNEFTFCLRTVGSSSCLATITTDDVENDVFTFTSPILDTLGISNPLVFSNIGDINQLELFIHIDDSDLGENDLVDNIFIRFDGILPQSTHTGQCGRANITLSIHSECSRGFQGSNCDTCARDYYPPNTCDVFCQPQNDSQGHFTCDPLTGKKICLPGFTNPASMCTEEATATTTGPDSSFGSTQLYIVIGVGAGVSVLAFLGAIILLACTCLLCRPNFAKDWDINCCKCHEEDCGDCFKIDCDNCCKLGCKSDDACDICVVCLLVILGILASPIIIIVGAVIIIPLVIILILGGLLYALDKCKCSCDTCDFCDPCDPCDSCDSCDSRDF